MLNTLRALCALPGVSGYEDRVRDYIRRAAEPHAQSIRTDAMGNLIVFKKGRADTGHRLMLCAHMDEVGLMVTRVTDDGYLKFDTVGGIDRRVLLGKPVLVGEGLTPGVIGLKAYHLVSSEEEKKVPKLEDFYIDIGAKDKSAAEERVRLGDWAVFAGDMLEFGDGLFKSKAIDDRIGCAVMLKLLARELPMDCVFVFTVQEELGTRGAMGAAFSVKPEIALILEGTTAADSPAAEEHRQVCALGKGPVIPFMDGGTVYDRALFKQLRTLAEEQGIPWQTKRFVAGGTDASAIQRARDGVRVCAISAAVRYLHAPSSVASVRDMEQIYTLALALIHSLAARAQEEG